MYNLNRVTIAGNLTRDPELKYTSNGKAKTRLDVAVNRRYKDRDDKLVDEVVFIPTIAWGTLAENVCKYLKKGRPVLVEGRLAIDKFTGEDDKQVTFAHIVASQIQFGPRKPGEAEAESEDAVDGVAEDDNVFDT
jgi:single-strand DNA-binding protein